MVEGSNADLKKLSLNIYNLIHLLKEPEVTAVNFTTMYMKHIGDVLKNFVSYS